MAENQDPSADASRPAPGPAGETAPSSGKRQGFLSAASERIRQVAPHGIPGARPRRRFEFPPEDPIEGTSPAGSDVPPVLPAATGSGGADSTARMSGHPIHFGFMFSVGVGIALLCYFILTNVGELLVWIGAALFIALGLDPIVRWLGARRIPRPAGIAITVLGLAGIVMGFFATLIPTIVRQTTEIINNAPGYVDKFLESEFFVNVEEQFHVRERIEEEVNKIGRASCRERVSRLV